MLPTFVIGLREGLEASLIVGIIAAFLRQRGRSDLLRWVFAGIFSAVLLCTAAGVTLDVVSRNLPQQQQEGLETVVGFVAVAMVTYMVVWMKRHSRNLKGQLEGAAGSALAAGSGLALVAMAFLAVLREGLETVVFLLAAFNEAGNGSSAAAGAVLGILTAVALGYAIYRGGVRLNLSKFFRATGVVLVLVAAGLVVSGLHTAHEAGWLNIGQQPTVDLSGVVSPGSVQSSLLTGMLGLQSRPVLIEVVGWLLYLVPLVLYVAWPPGRALPRGTLLRLAFAGAGVAAVGAVVLALVAPAAPTTHPTTTAGAVSARVLSQTPDQVVVLTEPLTPARATKVQELSAVTARHAGSQPYQGVPADVYRATISEPAPGPATMTLAQLAARGGGRLPLGVLSADGRPADGQTMVPVSRTSTDDVTFWVARQGGRVLNARWEERVTLVARFSIGATPVGQPKVSSAQLSDPAQAASVAAARHDSTTLGNRRALDDLAAVLTVAALALLMGGAALSLRGGRERRRTTSVPARGAPVSTRR